jgi:hypothetical protein
MVPKKTVRRVVVKEIEEKRREMLAAEEKEDKIAEEAVKKARLFLKQRGFYEEDFVSDNALYGLAVQRFIAEAKGDRAGEAKLSEGLEEIIKSKKKEWERGRKLPEKTKEEDRAEFKNDMEALAKTMGIRIKEEDMLKPGTEENELLNALIGKINARTEDEKADYARKAVKIAARIAEKRKK